MHTKQIKIKKPNKHLQEEGQGLLEEKVHKHHCQHKEEHKDHPSNQLSQNPLMKPKGLLLTAQHSQLTQQAEKHTKITKLR